MKLFIHAALASVLVVGPAVIAFNQPWYFAAWPLTGALAYWLLSRETRQ